MNIFNNISNKIALYMNANYHRNKNMIVFGAWMGMKFADNPKYLFLEAVQRKEFNVLWVTRNVDVYTEMKSKGLPVEMVDSREGIEFQRNAMFFVICTGVKDVNQDYLGGAVIINQWHGVPLKKVMWDDAVNHKFIWLKWRIKALVDYIPLHKMYVLSTSAEMQKIMARSFKRDKKWIPILGQARNDLFFSNEFSEKIDTAMFKGKKVITYMPTHRNEGKTRMLIEELLDLKLIETLCQKYGYVFVVKKHYYHRDEDISYSYAYEHIIDLTREPVDSQELLKYSDVLITDYSSCYIDYLLLDRPILFYAFDLERYLEEDRGMNLTYEEAAAGSILKNKNSISCEIENVMMGYDNYRGKRTNVKKIFYDEDVSGHSGEKVFDFIRSL